MKYKYYVWDRFLAYLTKFFQLKVGTELEEDSIRLFGWVAPQFSTERTVNKINKSQMQAYSVGSTSLLLKCLGIHNDINFLTIQLMQITIIRKFKLYV